MKAKVGIIALPILFLVGCATGGGNLQTVVDPSYNFILENTNKIPQNSYVNFKVSSVKNGVISGVLINNVFNSDLNVILFKVGDKITINYSIQGDFCSFNNADIVNYKNEDTILNGFVLMNGDNTFNCTPKTKTVGFNVESDVYTIKALSSTLPILNGVATPDISKMKSDSLYSFYKVVTPRGNLSWIPTKVYDNGIQTYIEVKVPNSDNGSLLAYNNLGGLKAYHINYSLYNDGILIDGVYNNISLIFSSKGADRGEVSILRSNLPNSGNGLVEKLYQMRDGFYKQDGINQQGALNSVYNMPQSDNGVASSFNQQNQSKYSDDMIIAKSNSPQYQSNTKQLNVKSPVNSGNSVVSSQNSNGSVPPLNNMPLNNSGVYSVDNAPTTTTVNSSDGQVDTPAPTSGVSIMGKLGF